MSRPRRVSDRRLTLLPVVLVALAVGLVVPLGAPGGGSGAGSRMTSGITSRSASLTSRTDIEASTSNASACSAAESSIATVLRCPIQVRG